MKTCRKKSGICFIIFTFILLSYNFSFAQYEDIQAVQFKNGSVVYGRVIKMSVDEIRIETKDGKIISDKFDNVLSLIKNGEKPVDLSKPRHLWKTGTEISYIEYEEPGLMKNKGMMYGIVGSYAYHGPFMFKAEGKFACGQVDYEGGTWDGTPLTIKNIPDYMLEVRALLGSDYVIKAHTITPYSGVGYRWLNDNSQEKSASGYKRTSNYLYIPIGLEYVVNLGNGWFLGASGEYDLFVRGKQISSLGDVDPGFNNIENEQKKGYGVRGSVSVEKRGGKVGFAVEPYIRYWNISDADEEIMTYYGIPTGYVFEPKNISTEIGCKLAVTF